jgi:hypothetical protein
MSTGSVEASQHQSPFTVHSIHFRIPGSAAIRLKDPVTDEFLGTAPEWCDVPPCNDLVAFVRNSRASIRVVFRGDPAANGTHGVGADGSPVQIEEKRVTLAFDPVTGLSDFVEFCIRNRLPNRIGLHAATLNWYIRSPADSPLCVLGGTTTARICTTWKQMDPRPIDRLDD